MGERIGAALEYAARTDFRKLADGRHEVRGDEIYALVQRYQTKCGPEGKWEAHRRYIDLQYVVDGQECFGVASADQMTVTDEGDIESDCLFLEGQGQFVTLSAGSFLVLMPNEPHMPGIAIETPQPVIKVVVKILAD